MKEEILEAKNSSAPKQGTRTHLKANSIIEFPKGSTDALDDLEEWLREFDRVTMHISNNQGMNSQDRILHLMAAWPKGTDFGDELRLEQTMSVYLEWERKFDLSSVGSCD